MAQVEARRKGQSVTQYENLVHEQCDSAEAASQPKTGFGSKLSKLFGGAKSTASAKRLHHEYGKVRYIYTVSSSLCVFVQLCFSSKC